MTLREQPQAEVPVTPLATILAQLIDRSQLVTLQKVRIAALHYEIVIKVVPRGRVTPRSVAAFFDATRHTRTAEVGDIESLEIDDMLRRLHREVVG